MYLSALTLVALIGPLQTTAPVQAAERRPFWSGQPTPSSFAESVDRRLARAQQGRARLLAVSGARTVANTLQTYDDIQRDLDDTRNEAQFIAAVHPDSAMRATAEAAESRVADLAAAISLDRGVYQAVAAMDVNGADAATRYYVDRTLLAFRLAGVDKDDSTREKIRRLREELEKLSQAFNRNIREDVRKVTVTSAAELDGLPADYISAHPPGADGRITITTTYPDALPVFTYARNEDLRKRLRMEFDNRAYPANQAVLDTMIAKRDQIAHLVGYRSWADYITADKMVGSAANASAFIDRIVAASDEAAKTEYERILRRKQQDDPSATTVTRWESAYYRELVRRSDYDFDSQRVRPYFPYDEVKQGVLNVSSRLFGVKFRRMSNPPVWDPSVEGWEMLEDGRVIGRFYLDMHPRPGKYEHAAQFSIRVGTSSGDLPESALVCNLPGGKAGDPGLMTHDDVVTFFHEFGHLVHAILGSRQRWEGTNSGRTQWDFVEAPSQMLEEWTWDPAVLATFARHYKTREPIPAALVRQMRRANDFGRALDVRQQMAYARVSLSFYDRPPAQVNADSIVMAVNRAYTPFPPMPETHFQASFGHLDSYSAIYYTYMWSQVIAKDLFSAFDRRNLLAQGPAHRYRDAILVPGGSAPADSLIERFLGRPFSFGAWENWLTQED
jgi:thimet oligopeptidase